MHLSAPGDRLLDHGVRYLLCGAFPATPLPNRPLGVEGTGTYFTFSTGDMVYKPLTARVALIAGLRRALPLFPYTGISLACSFSRNWVLAPLPDGRTLSGAQHSLFRYQPLHVGAYRVADCAHLLQR